MVDDSKRNTDHAILKARYGGTAGERRIDIPDRGLDTPYGRLYRPLDQWQQILALLAAFFGGPGVGWITGSVIGDLSETASTLLYVPYVLVFFTGYALWVARLNAIAFEGIGRAVIRTLFNLIVFRRKPASVDEVLPTRKKLLEMLVRAQKAGASFATVSWPIGLLAGFGAMLFDSAWSAGALFFVVAVTCVVWGYVLAHLGRRGGLPFMEEG